MSVRAISRVLDASQHGGSELLMLVVLADYSDDAGNSYPSVASLARKCRMTSRNANYILSALQASGELRVLKNQGPGGKNRYQLMLDRMGEQPLKPASPLKATSPPEAGFTPESPFTLKPTSATPEAGFPKPLKPASDEPSLNHQEPSSKARKRAGGRVVVDLPEWVPDDAWGDFVEMRKSIRKPMTAKGAELNLSKLEQLRDEGHDPRAVLEQSVASSWHGLFPIRPQRTSESQVRDNDQPAPRNLLHADKQLT